MEKVVTCECLDPIALAFKAVSDLGTAAAHKGEGWNIDDLVTHLDGQLKRLKNMQKL